MSADRESGATGDERPPGTPKPPPSPDPSRTVLKFDSGRRGFTRAIVTLAVAAASLLAFALYFFWNLL